MKIIGLTNNGYLCEVSKDEMKLSTGVEESWSPTSHSHKVGQIVNAPQIAAHIRAMDYTVKQRKDAAETLRSCANIIETVPDAFTAPLETKTEPSSIQRAAANLRAALE